MIRTKSSILRYLTALGVGLGLLATGCVSVTMSTRRKGRRLCSSMSIAERQACEPGMT